MTIAVYLDSCAWNYFFERGVDLARELPAGEFKIYITREVEIELGSIPEIGVDGSDKSELKAYIRKTRENLKVHTTSIFGFATVEPDGTLSRAQTYGGFGHGTFQTQRERDWYQDDRVKLQLKGKKRDKSGLGRNQADASLAVRSHGAIVITAENRQSPGPLKTASENGGAIAYLSDYEKSGRTLREYLHAVLLLPEGRDRLVSMLSCPLDWDRLSGNEEFSSLLRYLWYVSVRNREIDNESAYLQTREWRISELLFGTLLEDELVVLANNVSSWRSAACEEYFRRVERFNGLKVVASATYEKHYCAISSTDEEVAALSLRRNVGVMFPRIDERFQEALIWPALVELWYLAANEIEHYNDVDTWWHQTVIERAFDEMFSCNDVRLAAKLNCETGCSEGLATRYLVLDFDFSTRQVHAFPVSEEKAKLERYQIRLTP